VAEDAAGDGGHDDTLARPCDTHHLALSALISE
jgi:hypothetical protein